MKLRHLLPALLLAALPLTAAHAFVDVSISVAPPVIPVYEQPPCPVEGYLWTPGYYGYGDDGYYWVPGVWCAPPRVGFLWTPGYWGYDDGFYAFHTGYWGPTVGFYGGVDYGYGYGGYGYYGGRWDGGVFRYNTAVTRVNTTIIRNTYVNKTVIRGGARPGGASFNGRGGISARPDARQLAAARGPRVQPTGAPGGETGSGGAQRDRRSAGATATPQRAVTARTFPSPQQQDDRQSPSPTRDTPRAATAFRPRNARWSAVGRPPWTNAARPPTAPTALTAPHSNVRAVVTMNAPRVIPAATTGSPNHAATPRNRNASSRNRNAAPKVARAARATTASATNTATRAGKVTRARSEIACL